MSCQPPLAQVLWTGGWDSSYRVLELALVHRVEVQPHYVIDVDRISSLHELRAIRTMREMVAERDAEAGARIRPLRIVAINDIIPDAATAAHYRALRRRGELGGQYAFLSRYARQSGLNDLELSVHVDDAAAAFVVPGSDSVTADTDSGLSRWRLAGTVNDPAMQLFAPFRFPLLDLTKIDMKHAAIRHGFADILDESWFCHTPIVNRPCGYCRPCVYAMQEGVGYRLGAAARVRYRFRSVLFPLRVLKERPGWTMRRIMRRTAL